MTKLKRPEDVLYVHSDGTKAKIAFVWGKRNNPVPKGLAIKVKSPSHKYRDIRIHCDHQGYLNLDQARKQGLILSQGIVDLLSEPLD